MAINFDNALGLTPKALQLLGQRTAVLANNIANADTPNYKARELPFHAMLNDAISGNSRETMATTSPQHIDTTPAESISSRTEPRWSVV